MKLREPLVDAPPFMVGLGLLFTLMFMFVFVLCLVPNVCVSGLSQVSEGDEVVRMWVS